MPRSVRLPEQIIVGNLYDAVELRAESRVPLNRHVLGHQFAPDLIGFVEQLLIARFDGRGVVTVRAIQQTRAPVCRSGGEGRQCGCVNRLAEPDGIV